MLLRRQLEVFWIRSGYGGVRLRPDEIFAMFFSILIEKGSYPGSNSYSDTEDKYFSVSSFRDGLELTLFIGGEEIW